MDDSLSYQIFPLGDSAVTIDFGNLINEDINKKIISLFEYISQHPAEGMIDVIPAYSSITVCFDLFMLRKISQYENVFEWMKRKMQKILQEKLPDLKKEERLIRIPVCYKKEFAVDLQWLARQKNISTAEVIQIHTSKIYRVYMLGFLPGFPYMGEVDEKISVPRQPQPKPVKEGSVGIAGRQTGIYPQDSPGGWQIIGRTPVKLFAAEKENPCLLKPGDKIEFYSISKDEFENYQSRNT